jgi:MATE family multidrug resistance protein
LHLLQVVLCLHYEEVRRTLRPPSWRALTEWPAFLSLAAPGTVMICSEWWAYEILTLFAGLLGTSEVAAQTIILQTSTMAYTVMMMMMIV